MLFQSTYPSQQVLASTTQIAAAGASITLAPKAGFLTVVSGVTLTTGVVATAVHGIWTVSDGTWTQSYYVLMSNVPYLGQVNYIPGLYSTAPNTAITITVPAITGGAPFALAAQGYYVIPG